jgi:hypothetical protein
MKYNLPKLHRTCSDHHLCKKYSRSPWYWNYLVQLGCILGRRWFYQSDKYETESLAFDCLDAREKDGTILLSSTRCSVHFDVSNAEMVDMKLEILVKPSSRFNIFSCSGRISRTRSRSMWISRTRSRSMRTSPAKAYSVLPSETFTPSTNDRSLAGHGRPSRWACHAADTGIRLRRRGTLPLLYWERKKWT